MSEHTFKISQLVEPKVRFASTARGPYQIKQRMPSVASLDIALKAHTFFLSRRCARLEVA